MTRGRFLAWSFSVLRSAGWPALALFAFHVIATRGFHAYLRFPLLDVPVHFLGGMCIAFFFHRAALAASDQGFLSAYHRLTHAMLVFALTCTATVAWEFAEFLSDRYFGTQAQLGLEDTLGDMLFGICGGIALVLVISFRPARTHV